MNTPTAMIMRPEYAVLDLPAALAGDWSGYHVSEKMDGRWHELAIGANRIVGELMPDGTFFAFDIPIFDGRDIRQRPKAERLEILDTFKLRRPPAPMPGESAEDFIRRTLAGGGEGAVISNLESPWGCDIWKAKRVQTFDCVVTDLHPDKLSLHLALAGEDVGWCPCLRQSAFDAIRRGDVVEVAAYGRHASGKFREPRFIRVRHDKSGGK